MPSFDFSSLQTLFVTLNAHSTELLSPGKHRILYVQYSTTYLTKVCNYERKNVLTDDMKNQDLSGVQREFCRPLGYNVKKQEFLNKSKDIGPI